MSETKLNIKNKLSSLIDAGVTESDLIAAFKTIKQERSEEEKRQATIKEQREKLISEMFDYFTFVANHKTTEEEEKILTEYIDTVLIRCENILQREEPKKKVTKRAWRNGKELSEAEADKIISEFWNRLL